MVVNLAEAVAGSAERMRVFCGEKVEAAKRHVNKTASKALAGGQVTGHDRKTIASKQIVYTPAPSDPDKLVCGFMIAATIMGALSSALFGIAGYHEWQLPAFLTKPMRLGSYTRQIWGGLIATTAGSAFALVVVAVAVEKVANQQHKRGEQVDAHQRVEMMTALFQGAAGIIGLTTFVATPYLLGAVALTKRFSNLAAVTLGVGIGTSCTLALAAAATQIYNKNNKTRS